MTKTETHSYIRFQKHLDKDSYCKPELYPKDTERDKPTLADHNGDIQAYRKDIRAFYKDRT